MKVKVTIDEKIKKQVYSALLRDECATDNRLSPETHYVLKQIIEQIQNELAEEGNGVVIID